MCTIQIHASLVKKKIHQISKNNVIRSSPTPHCLHCNKRHSLLTLIQLFTHSDTCVPAGSSQPVIVAVGVVLGLIMCGSCLMAGVWWKRRYCILKPLTFFTVILFHTQFANSLTEMDL